jgi:multiple sugar transport system permease protein
MTATAGSRRGDHPPQVPGLWTRLTRSGTVGRPSPLTRAASYALLTAAVVIFVTPFLFIVASSFKEGRSLFQYPPEWIPDPIYTGNYEKLLFRSPFPRWLLNTLFVAGTVTTLKIFIDSLAGYAFAKMQITGKNVLFVVMIACLMIPFGAISIPLYFFADALGITNSYWALILPPLANPIGIFLMRQFIEGLPRDLENAARLDGVSEFGIYWRIVLPLLKPGLVVLAVITFTDQYMSFFWPLISIRSQDLQVLTTGVSSLRTYGMTDYGLWSAAAVMAMVPIAIFFFLLQKQFLARSIAGALKQ